MRLTIIASANTVPRIDRYRDASIIALGLLFILAMFFFCTSKSFFFNDDFYNFLLYKNSPFIDYLFSPVDVHFVPLHRLLSAAILIISPLNYDLAVFVLLGFHAASWLLLYRILDIIHRGWINLPLTFLFGANVYLSDVLSWWSAGAHRFPYILLSLLAIHAYLRYRNAGRRSLAVLCLAAFALALGFYVKALLIPIYIAAMEISLAIQERRWPGKKIIALIVSMTAAAAAYAVWYLEYAPVVHLPLALYNIDMLHVIGWSMAIASEELLPSNYHRGVVEVVAILLWMLLLVWSARHATGNIAIFILGVLLLLLNIIFIAASSRGMLIEPHGLAKTYRYYFETAFMQIIFIGLLIRGSRAPASGSRAAMAQAYLKRSMPLLILIYLVSSYVAMQARFSTYPLTVWLTDTHDYMTNVLAGLRRIENQQDRSMIDAIIPVYIQNFAPPLYRSDVLPLIDGGLTYDRTGGPHLYNIDKAGKLAEIDTAPAAIAARFAPRSNDQLHCLAGGDLALSAGPLRESPFPYRMAVIDYRASAAANLAVSFSASGDRPASGPDRVQSQRLDPRDRSMIFVYGSPAQPAAISGSVTITVIDPPPGLCITGIALQAFRQRPFD
jgi:hypothetical protein